jgi:hypothetical protein
MILYGLLFCHGTMHDKAVHWYGVLQEGGSKEHPTIAAMDKDTEHAVKKMCEFVTTDAFGEFVKIGGVEKLYTDDELAKFNTEVFTTFRENILLEDVFGTNSALNYEDWLKNMILKAPYMFSAKILRRHVVDKAELDYKYYCLSPRANPVQLF